jgi:FkbM family methyltransferase
MLPVTEKWQSSDHYYDQLLLAYLGLIFDPARSVIDVGANVGYVTRFLAQRCTNQVYAIEASPLNFAALEQNCKDLTNVTGINAAVSDTHDDVILVDSGSTLCHVAFEGKTRSKNAKTIKTVILDELVLNNVGLIKIDTEGFEMRVLNGARKLIQEQQPIVVAEVDEHHLKQQHSSSAEIFAFFESLGYMKPRSTTSKTTTEANDLVFAPKGTYLPQLYRKIDKDYESNENELEESAG